MKSSPLVSRRLWSILLGALVLLGVAAAPPGTAAAGSTTLAPLPLRVRAGMPHAIALLPTEAEWFPCSLAEGLLGKNPCQLYTIAERRMSVTLAGQWGGSIASMVYDGHELIDSHDTGRLVQLALRDNCSESWNPTQGGSTNGTGDRIGAVYIAPRSLTTVSQMRDWTSNRLTHVFVTQTLSVVAPTVLRMQYTLVGRGIQPDHLRRTPSTCPADEMPALYAYHHLTEAYTYAGSRPWTGAALTRIRLRGAPSGANGGQLTAVTAASEHWLALINPRTGIGLGLLIPNPPGPGAQWFYSSFLLIHPRPNYLSLHVRLPIVNGTIARETVYLVVGTLGGIRQEIYAVHHALCAHVSPVPARSVPSGDATPPFCVALPSTAAS